MDSWSSPQKNHLKAYVKYIFVQEKNSNFEYLYARLEQYSVFSKSLDCLNYKKASFDLMVILKKKKKKKRRRKKYHEVDTP